MESWSNSCKTAVIGCCLPMPSLVSGTVAVPSPAHSLVHCSRSPAAVLGVLFCPHLEQNIGSWKRLSGQGHVHAHVHCGLRNRHFPLRENGGSMCGCGSNSLRSLPPVLCDHRGSRPRMHQADQVKRTDQPYNTQPRSSVAGPFPLPDVTNLLQTLW